MSVKIFHCVGVCSSGDGYLDLIIARGLPTEAVLTQPTSYRKLRYKVRMSL